METFIEFLKEVGKNQEVLIFLAGATATAVTQLIKSGTKWKEQAALSLAFFVSASLALLSSWANNGYVTPADFVNNFTAIYTLATIFYKTIVEPQVRLKKLEAERDILLLVNARQNES